jgi:hypothetical protein
MFGSLFKRTAKGRKALTSPDSSYRHWLHNNRDRALKVQEAGPAYLDTPRIAEELTENGILIGTTDQYLDEEGHEAFAEASKMVLGISRNAEVQSAIAKGGSDYKKKDYLVHLIPSDQKHGPDSPIFRLALNRKLLEIISLYLGMWPRLHAMSAWLNLPSAGEAKQSQLWHRDPEDMRLVKVFIYLDDVDINCGPFSYIPKTHPFGAKSALNPKHNHPKRITDDEMRVAIPSEEWVACAGPAGSMILADTVGFHRGGKATIGNRILITFTYTSGTPFGSRSFQFDGVPDWASSEIQRYALLPGGV